MALKWLKDDEDIDPFDQAAVRQHLLDIERVYNRHKERFYYLAQSYFHQPIGSTYVKADDLQALMNRCEELRTQHKNFKDHVAEVRGTKYVI